VVSPNAPPARRGGNGLVNMRQRLSDIGGECLVRSRPDDGATITMRIPLNPVAAKKS